MWASFPSLVESRCYPGLVTVDDVLYAVGGKKIDPTMRFFDGDHPMETVYSLETVERYDSKQKQWVADVEPMSRPRCGNDVTSCLGRIFGITDIGYKWSVEAYNPEKNRWFPISSPSGRASFHFSTSGRAPYWSQSVAAFSDQVYVFKLEYDYFGYIRYDPIEDRWQDFSPAPFSLDTLSELTVTISDSIYFFSRGSICASFTSKSEQWSKLSPSFSIPSDCYGVAGDRNKLYSFEEGSMRIIDLDSSNEKKAHCHLRSDYMYSLRDMQKCGAKFISRNFVLNLM